MKKRKKIILFRTKINTEVQITSEQRKIIGFILKWASILAFATPANYKLSKTLFFSGT